MLASPRFLYLYDGGATEQKSLQIEEINLASRLSFFLWGSLPDEDLLKSANEGTLSDKETLKKHVDRMLLNHKLKRFCDSFPTQWLQLDRIISAVPDERNMRIFTTLHLCTEPPWI